MMSERSTCVLLAILSTRRSSSLGTRWDISAIRLRFSTSGLQDVDEQVGFVGC
jgi:hypothetical protein